MPENPLQSLFDKNRVWSEKVKKNDPEFFSKLSHQQSPKYLWIGCSDSRVAANELLDLMPGEIFVHRNIANVVVHTDLNCLSVIEYAVKVLKVSHIIVCGHYGCGGITAALAGKNYGLFDNWLRHIKDVYRLYQNQIDSIEDDVKKADLLCELNVVEQVANVCHTSIVQNAWKEGHQLTIHGWIYNLADGILRDLKVNTSEISEISETHRIE